MKYHSVVAISATRGYVTDHNIAIFLDRVLHYLGIVRGSTSRKKRSSQEALVTERLQKRRDSTRTLSILTGKLDG